eukprot:4665048-Amphidinium_carterae.1
MSETQERDSSLGLCRQAERKRLRKIPDNNNKPSRVRAATLRLPPTKRAAVSKPGWAYLSPAAIPANLTSVESALPSAIHLISKHWMQALERQKNESHPIHKKLSQKAKLQKSLKKHSANK